MKENKNIDQFFKDKFENFEVNPPEEIWQNIEEKLQKKKKRRVIPFWWFTSSIAALLVIGLFVFNNYYTFEIHPKNDFVIDKNMRNKTNNEKSNSSEKENDTKIVLEENNIKDDLEKTNVDADNVYKENEASKAKQNLMSNSIVKKQKLNSNNTIVTNNESKDFFSNKSNSSNTIQIADLENKTIEKKENIVQNNSIFNANKMELNNGNNIVLGKVAVKNNNSVATKGEVYTSKDSTAIATVEPNELEELLKEKENQIAQEQKMNRWQVTPNLAPIYFGSFDKGSPLDSNLDENTKSFNNNLSYGVAVNYTINKKIKIRTGINSFTVDYNTNDIVFFESSNARMMKNIDPTIRGSLIEIIPIKNINPFFNKMVTEQNTGILNQKMGFIEMPMEISYTLLNKKFGVEILGGLSTLFLSKNEVFLEAEGINVKIGEASNLNPVHFSTNIGVGFNYGFSKKFQ